MTGLNKLGQFFCPHCLNENPPYEFVYSSGGSPNLKVEYLTVVCGGKLNQALQLAYEREQCRFVYSVAVIGCEISRLPMVGG
jgi:hypothetical protein